jgi:tetratricopeptide (TPR) repeat protein
MAAAGACCLPAPLSAGSARAWEEEITLPTYKVAPPDPNPRFYNGRTYQGAKATFYPYPVSDQMTETRENRKYKCVFLENDYIKFSVLPELGGRIFTAEDKGNHYDFFYRQHVIKPALIGMLGAWISGGVEWNVPHHHRASSFMPVDSWLEENPDGSKTLWVGETELRHRLKWILGLTLRPDRSYIEMTAKIFNRTPAAQSFLFWINPAVHANTNYQVIFPPSTDWAVQHGKPEFASWPIARQVYGGTDYTRGVDISWWKNHPSPVSFFAWNCQEDFFGGYDHGRQAGVVQISNHNVSPGKKFFEWGNGAEGEMWTRILSDEDGPYLELMAGSYSDNQPDYSWIEPGEVKIFKHFWYPVRDLGGVKNATTQAAVNLEITNQTIHVAFNTTSAHRRAQVRLAAGEDVFFTKVLGISPREPFRHELPLPENVRPSQVRVSLVGDDGAELVAYQMAERTNSVMPKPVTRPAPPKEIPSNEELYYTGLRIEQLYSPSFEPLPYYKEILNRDPGDYRANTAIGSLLCRQGRFAEAEAFLRTAVARSTENYIRPKDCEAQYYLGVALRGQGKASAAREAFYKSIWSQGRQAAGYQALAELACAKENDQEALLLVERALQAGGLNTKALELKCTLLRKAGRADEARAVAQAIRAIDPLNPRALLEETTLATGNKTQAKRLQQQLVSLLRGEVSSYLELSLDYANCGLYEEATRPLEIYFDQLPKGQKPSPLAYYYLAFFHERAGKQGEAYEEYALAGRMPPEFCFPFQFEAETILRRALELFPNDSRAQYYLGNLLYDYQPSNAIPAWQKAVQIDDKFVLAWRNLGFARAQTQKNITEAITCLERAVALKPLDPRLYFELDSLYEAAGKPLQKRLDLLNKHAEIVALRDDAVTRRISLLTAAGNTGEALTFLRERRFHNWEGSGALHDVYVDACLRSGDQKLADQTPDDALRDYLAALEYPLNQEVGKSRREQRVAQIFFSIGLAKQALNNKPESEEAFRKASDSREGSGSEGAFYRALALRKLGKETDAMNLFVDLQNQGQADLTRESESLDYFAKFGERRPERLRKAQAHFLAGLGSYGLGRFPEAKTHFEQCLELHPAHLGALKWSKALLAGQTPEQPVK